MLELPGASPLKDAHAALDAAVLEACGFSPRKDLLTQLLALNFEVAGKIENGKPVIAPGVPPNYPDAKSLVTEDCIQPGGGDDSTAESAAGAAHYYFMAKEDGPAYRSTSGPKKP